MAKTVDLRTYLALERAFVRRLQRSWRIQSAPTYAKITQACLDHKWDEARRLVPDLDMAEVGTENREWITYMLLSLAVFGAGTVAKGKPSFVGVGTFDTFLKQVTNNMLQYLEYKATARVQADALQLIADDEAQTKALPKVAWEEAQHPRDKEGQFTDKGAGANALMQEVMNEPIEGSGPARAEWNRRNIIAMDAFDAFLAAKKAHRAQIDRVTELITAKMAENLDVPLEEAEKAWGEDKDYLVSKLALQAADQARKDADAALAQQDREMKKEIIRNVAYSVAVQMGVDPYIISVVYEEPHEFKVGNKQFTEAGHYTPSTGLIQLNAHSISYADTPSLKGIVAHEVSHYIWHRLQEAVEDERARYKQLAGHYQDKGTDWFYERFDQPHRYAGVGGTTLKPEMRAQVEKEFPASAVWAKLSGGEMFTGISGDMKVENGHSQYAKSYWAREAVMAKGTYDTAINETTAEVSRWLVSPSSWHPPDHPPLPRSPWVQFTKAMHTWYTEGNEFRKAGVARIRADYARNYPKA